MSLVLFRDCRWKGLSRYTAYIEQKDGITTVSLSEGLLIFVLS